MDVKLYMQEMCTSKKKKKKKVKFNFIQLLQLLMMMTIIINPSKVSIHFLYLNRDKMKRCQLIVNMENEG